MKNLLLLSLILISAPVFATCPLEDNGSCSVAAGLMQEPVQRSFSRSRPMVKEFSNTPDAMQATTTDQGGYKMRNFGPSSTNYSYNTSCLFGVCRNTGTPTLFQDRE